MKTFEIPNYRIFKVKYVGPTNTRGSYVKIEETARYNDDKNKVVKLGYDYTLSDIQEQAAEYLESKGFKIVGRASEKDHYYLFADNWGSNFIELE